jgi:2Fe-2S iron-sulfur cluster binding domain/NADH-ubiquinone oxidoreductase-F iron-sulfur binding region
VPCRVGTVRQEELLARLARGTPLGSNRQELVLLDDIAAVARDASVCGLGQTAVSAATSAVGLGLIGRNGEGARMGAVFLEAPRRLVDVTIDGQTVRVPEGATLLDACRQLGIDIPTLCYLANLTPVNVCRVSWVPQHGVPSSRWKAGFTCGDASAPGDGACH